MDVVENENLDVVENENLDVVENENPATHLDLWGSCRVTFGVV